MAKALPGVKVDSWSVLLDRANLAKLKDCGVYFLADGQDMYGSVLRFMGKDPNSTSVADYQAATETLAQQGEELFRKFGCSGCHGANSTVHAPSLAGLYGNLVHLQDGSVRRADRRYIRDCILQPRSFTVAGYPPVMPDFSGQVSEEDLVKLIAYIQSLSPGSAADGNDSR